MTDPTPLGAGYRELMESFPPEHPLHRAAAGVIGAFTECAERRARVLKHEDLAARLTLQPVGYNRASQWNGYVPPRLIDPEGNQEALLTVILERGGGVRYRFHALGLRARGEYVNDSPRRAALVAICAEAYERELTL